MKSAPLPEGYSSAKRLHAGPSSEVYSALRQLDDRRVVLKAYVDTSESRRRAAAAREVEALRAVAGPGIPAVLDVLLDHPVPVLVMEQAQGVALASWAEAALPDLEAVLTVARRLAAILAHVHASRFIHCDVNPRNVIVEPATLETHLIDFALARRLGSADRGDAAPAGELEGTLMYIAPEQTGRMNRGCDARSDLYSLGATLYHALTGRTPFESTDALELIHAHIARLPAAPRELRSDLPEVVSRLVLKLLRKAPEERYPSAIALEADLATCLDQLARSGQIASDLELGAAGIPDRLRFTSHLYGREPQVARLRALYASVTQGSSGILWLDGEPGSGKSSLVDTLRPLLAETRGHLAAAKLDRYGERPYAAWEALLGSLVHQLLIQSDARLERWKRELSEGLGGIAGALLPLVPDLRLIVGEASPVPALGPRETQARLSLAVRRLLGVCSGPEHPLVVFLDDVQWSDAGSRFLLEDLLGSGVPAGMLLVCAYRKAELDDAHPLAGLPRRLAERGIAAESVSLAALPQHATVAMLSDTLERTPDETRGLAELLERKTGNNPMLVRQFLEHIHARGLLRYARGAGWHWDPAEIAAADIPEGAVALMTARIGRLEPEARALIEFASCVGEEFDAGLLAERSGRERRSLEPALDALTDAGLIAPSPRGLRFAHSRIREAVQALLGDSARARLHYDMARLLLARIPEPEREQSAAAIVEHLNPGLAHLGEELRPIAIRLNFASGKQALRSGAASAAESCFSVARQLLREEDWADDHRLAFDIHLRSSESALVRSDFVGALAALDVLEPRCSSVLERGEIAAARIRVLALTTPPEECMRYTFEVLRGMGIRSPLRPSRLRTQVALRITQWRLRGRRWIVRPAQTRDPRRLAALLVIGAAGGILPRLDIYMMALLSCWIQRANLRQGFVTRPAFSLSAFASWLQVVSGDARASQRFSRHAFELAEMHPDPALQPRMELQLFAIQQPFWMRRRQAVAALDRVADSLAELGDVEYAAYARFLKIYFAGLAGEAVAETERKLSELAKAVQDSGQHYPVVLGALPIQRLLRQRKLDAATLHAALAESEAWLAASGGSDSYLRTLWMLVLSVLGRHDLAFEQSERLGELRFRMVPYVQAVDHAFYRGLAAAALAGDSARSDRRRYLRELRAERRRVARAARAGPDFEHMALLLAAERARLRRDIAGARALYEQAAQRARQQDFIHHAALAHERRGRMLAALRRETEAAAAFRDAEALYARWGAEGKAATLGQERRTLIRE